MMGTVVVEDEVGWERCGSGKESGIFALLPSGRLRPVIALSSESWIHHPIRSLVGC